MNEIPELESKISIKENRDCGESSRKSREPRLSTLFSLESLTGRPPKNEYLRREGKAGRPVDRYVAGIVKSDPPNAGTKAKSLRILLDKNILTHVCMSSDIGQALITELRQPRYESPQSESQQ